MSDPRDRAVGPLTQAEINFAVAQTMIAAGSRWNSSAIVPRPVREKAGANTGLFLHEWVPGFSRGY
jgi:hypothetical protein